MNEVEGIYRDGRVDLSSPVHWPNGTPVTVQSAAASSEPPGTSLPQIQRADGTILEWSDTPEFREALIAQMESHEPVELTTEEEAEWQKSLDWFGKQSLEFGAKDLELPQ